MRETPQAISGRFEFGSAFDEEQAMALVRCALCALENRRFVSHVFPVGYPNTGVICGRPRCRLRGLIWLDRNETRAQTRRRFELGDVE